MTRHIPVPAWGHTPDIVTTDVHQLRSLELHMRSHHRRVESASARGMYDMHRTERETASLRQWTEGKQEKTRRFRQDAAAEQLQRDNERILEHLTSIYLRPTSLSSSHWGQGPNTCTRGACVAGATPRRGDAVEIQRATVAAATPPPGPPAKRAAASSASCRPATARGAASSSARPASASTTLARRPSSAGPGGSRLLTVSTTRGGVPCSRAFEWEAEERARAIEKANAGILQRLTHTGPAVTTRKDFQRQYKDHKTMVSRHSRIRRRWDVMTARPQPPKGRPTGARPASAAAATCRADKTAGEAVGTLSHSSLRYDDETFESEEDESKGS